MNIFSKLKNMNVLLVDDDQWIRNSMRLFFEAEGCYLVALETAEEAIKAINKKDYDIIITDYILPGMNGLEFLKEIEKSQPKAIKILITAYGNNNVVSEATKLGIQHFIEKPFTSDIIEKSLSFLIKNQNHC
ncbi:response regulator [bacterium]|nr:response regulator [bacterium]